MEDSEDSGGVRARAVALELDQGLDLSGVDPLRREEVRRRVAVVKAFIALPAPDDADRRAHADALGLSVNQFKALVRAWNEHPRASSMAQSGRSRGARRATGPRHLDAEARATAEETVAGLAPTATLAQAVEAVASACGARGLDVPKKTAVWKMLTAARRLQVDPSGRGVVVVGRCWLRMPMVNDYTLAMPSLAVAVRADDGVVLGATLRNDAATGAALFALTATQPGLISILVDDVMVDAAAFGAKTVGTPCSPSEIRRRLSRIFGNRIGGVQPVYKAGAETRPERLLRSRKDRPLSRADAAAVIRAAIDAHNAERGTGPATWVD